jgi:hypothetical protein
MVHVRFNVSTNISPVKRFISMLVASCSTRFSIDLHFSCSVSIFPPSAERFHSDSISSLLPGAVCTPLAGQGGA